MQDRNLDCQGLIAQGFLCSGSLSGGTQLELFYTVVPLSKFVWRTSCWRLCFRKPQIKPENSCFYPTKHRIQLLLHI